MSGLKGSSRRQNQTRTEKVLFLFEVQIKTDSCYEFIEKSRVNLTEIIGECTDVDMVFNNHAMLFTVKTYIKSLSHLMIQIYNMNSKHIEGIFEAFENPGKSKVFVVVHVNFKGGVLL